MRVFVSSTYKDLINHRRAIVNALERLGLGLERMEAFGARPEDATRAYLSEVEASDLFVGIYAHRYGYIPDDSAISITEAEFDHAYNNRRPTFCFFVDEGYPWPEDLKEGEPGQSLLRRFKERVEKIVVRDSFTTPEVLAGRVATSVGRYLLADPRRHGGPDAARYARLVLDDVATMAFVDLMRLACVAGSDLARTANQSRYNEFVDIADMHLGEFRTQVTRLTADADLDTLTKCGDVERSLTWGIQRLRRGPSLDRSWRKFVGTLRDTAERVNALAEAVSRDYYAARIGEVVSVIQGAARRVSADELARRPDTFVQSRFSAQLDVIALMQTSGGFAAATIRDDVDRRLAIPYFALDLELLRKATSCQ